MMRENRSEDRRAQNYADDTGNRHDAGGSWISTKHATSIPARLPLSKKVFGHDLWN
jgi:hypothetical protein